MKYGLLIILFFNFYLVYSQNTFQSLVFASENSTGMIDVTSTETEDGSIYLVASESVEGKYATRVVKLLKQGNIAWDKTYSNVDGQEYFPKIIPAHGGGVLLISTFSYSEPTPGFYKEVLTRKIDVDGNIEWKSVINADGPSEIVPTKDGNYVILAYVDGTKQGFVVTKMSSIGSIIWSNNLNSLNEGDGLQSEYPRYLAAIDDHIYVGSDRVESIMDNTENAFVYKLDYSGNLLWKLEREGPPDNFSISIEEIFKFKDKYYFQSTDLFEFSSNNGTFWNVSDESDLNIYSPKTDCSTNLEIVGVAKTDEGYVIRKYNTIDKLTTEFLVPSITHEFIDFEISNDGGYIIVSRAGSHLLEVTKVDCQGNANFWSNECRSELSASEDLFLYPNPATSQVRIECRSAFNEVELYNSLGAKTTFLNTCCCKNQTINVSGLASGIYYLKVSNQDDYFAKKLVII